MNHVPQFPPAAISVAAAIALASVTIAMLGLFAARVGRRSAPTRHGLLLSTLLVLVALPATPFAAALIDIAWLPKYRLFVLDSGADPVSGGELPSGATGIASAQSPTNSTFTTLSADEIPSGAILPGHSAGTTGFANASVSPHPTLAGSPDENVAGSSSAFATLRAIDSLLISQAALALWLFGSAISVLRSVRCGVAVSRIVRHATPIADPATLALLFEVVGKLRVHRPPRLCATAAVRVPFAWGLGRPVIVLPRKLTESGQTDRLRPILLHEMAHVRRHDAWIGVVQRIAAAMYWWNPLVRMLNARLADAREQICDAHVLAGGCPAGEYAELLVDLASQVMLPQPAAALGLLSRSQPQLTRRVQHLLEDQPMSTSLRKFAKFALMGLLVVLMTAALLIGYIVVDESLLFAQRDAFPVLTQRRPAQSVAVPLLSSRPVTNVAVQPAQQSFGDSGHLAPATPSLTFNEAGDAGFASEAQPDQDSFAADPNPAAGAIDADADFGGLEASPPPRGTLQGRGGRRRGGAGMIGGRYEDDEAKPVFAGPRLHGLALISLAAAEDGSLRNLYWFTQPLGAGEEAYAKLAERLSEFVGGLPQSARGASVTSGPMFGAGAGFTAAGGAGIGGEESDIVPARAGSRLADEDDVASFGGGRGAAGIMPPPLMAAMGGMGMMGGPATPTHIAAQISASPEIRYAELKRVIELCQQHVDRILFGADDSQVQPDITLTLGFVRDGGGGKISSSPVLIWNDAVVPELGRSAALGEVEFREPHDLIVSINELSRHLVEWRHTISGDAQRGRLTALIRPDAGIDAKLVERVVQATLPAGVERVGIQWLTGAENQDSSPETGGGDESSVPPQVIPFYEPAVPEAGEADTEPSPEPELDFLKPASEPGTEPPPNDDPFGQT